MNRILPTLLLSLPLVASAQTPTTGELLLRMTVDMLRPMAAHCSDKQPALRADFDTQLLRIDAIARDTLAPRLQATPEIAAAAAQPAPPALVAQTEERIQRTLQGLQQADAAVACPRFLQRLQVTQGEELAKRLDAAAARLAAPR